VTDIYTKGPFACTVISHCREETRWCGSIQAMGETLCNGFHDEPSLNGDRCLTRPQWYSLYYLSNLRLRHEDFMLPCEPQRSKSYFFGHVVSDLLLTKLKAFAFRFPSRL
jgi:hypothetical protein